MTVKSPAIPRPGETVIGGEFKMGAGGKGANQAVAAKRLGGDVTFVCKVGNDIFGDNAVESYMKEGMDVSHVLRSDKPSGVALILVDGNAENCISVATGANGDLSPADIEAKAELIRDCAILVLQNEIPVESVMLAAKIAHEAGAYVILNPAPACALPEEIFQYIDLMTPNQTESEFYTGIPVNDEESAQKAADDAAAAASVADGKAVAAQGEVDALETYVGVIPEGATATSIVGYIQEKTSGIASEGAMTELGNRVGVVEGKVDKVEGKGLSTEDYTTAEKTKLSGIEANANNYTLPAATTSALGGVKVGSNLAVDANGVISGNYSNASSSAAGLMSAADKTALDAKPDVYVQSTQPSGLKAGDIWFQISE